MVLLLNQHNVVARVGSLLGGRNPCNASSDHQHGLRNSIRDRLERFHFLGFDEAHAQVVLGKRLGFLVLRLMAPDDMLAEVDSLEYHPGVKGEGIGLDAWGAGRNCHGIHGVAGQVLLDQRHPLRAAQERMRAAHRNLVFFLGYLDERIHVQRLADGTPTADVHSQLLIHGGHSRLRFAGL